MTSREVPVELDDLLESKDSEIRALRQVDESLKVQTESRRLSAQENDVQSRLLEEIDQTASTLDSLRAEARSLAAENIRLATHKSVDSALRHKLESPVFVVAEALLLKKRKLVGGLRRDCLRPKDYTTIFCPR